MSLPSATGSRPADAASVWMPHAKSERVAHAGLLAGATVTGEAARQDLSIRVGLWLDESGRVRRARWRACADRALRASAEAACAHLEAGGDAAHLSEALAAAGHA